MYMYIYMYMKMVASGRARLDGPSWDELDRRWSVYTSVDAPGALRIECTRCVRRVELQSENKEKYVKPKIILKSVLMGPPQMDSDLSPSGVSFYGPSENGLRLDSDWSPFSKNGLRLESDWSPIGLRSESVFVGPSKTDSNRTPIRLELKLGSS